MANVKIKRLFVNVVAEIINPETGHVAGHIYQWNTGEQRKQWNGERLKIFTLRPLRNMPIDQTQNEPGYE